MLLNFIDEQSTLIEFWVIFIYNFRFLYAEVYGEGRTAEEFGQFYEFNGKKVTDMPSNMNLLKVNDACNAICVHELIKKSLNSVPVGGSNNWMVSLFFI